MSDYNAWYHAQNPKPTPEESSAKFKDAMQRCGTGLSVQDLSTGARPTIPAAQLVLPAHSSQPPPTLLEVPVTQAPTSKQFTISIASSPSGVSPQSPQAPVPTADTERRPVSADWQGRLLVIAALIVFVCIGIFAWRGQSSIRHSAILWTIDKLFRLAASITALLALPVIFIVGIMANDAGTPTGQAIGLTIMLVGLSFALFLLWASFGYAAIRDKSSAELTVPARLLATIVYLVGALGLSFGGYRLLEYAFRKPPQPLTVVAGEPAYPTLNKHPEWIVRIAGTLPTSVPLDHFDAEYITDETDPFKADPICKRNEIQGKMQFHYPLRHIETIEVVRSADRYSSTIVADRFETTVCKWHLQSITPRLRGNGEDFQPGGVMVAAQRPPTQFGSLAVQANSGRSDFWCRELPPPPKGKYVCGGFPQHSQGPSPASGEPTYSGPLWAYPDSGTLQINFHELPVTP
jgi:hypothetical protein